MPRRFTLSDAMVLIAAIAAGLAIPRSFGDFETVRRGVHVSFRDGEHSTTSIGVDTSDYMDRATMALFRSRIKGAFFYWSNQASFWPGPCLAALTLATFGIGLGTPRRSLRRLARRPGAAMAMAVIFAMAVTSIRLPHLLMAGSKPLRWAEWWLEFWFTLPRLAGFAVAVSWITLALSGRWKAGSGWRDRLGLAIGICWIGMAALDLAAAWCWALS